MDIKQEILLLYEQMFRIPELKMRNLQAMADRLSDLAGRAEPWTAKYLHSLAKGHRGFSSPSREFVVAISILKESLNGNEASMTISNNVISSTVLPPGTIIQGSVRQCDWDECRVVFVPAWGRTKYHSRECARKAKNKRARERRKSTPD